MLVALGGTILYVDSVPSDIPSGDNPSTTSFKSYDLTDTPNPGWFVPTGALNSIDTVYALLLATSRSRWCVLSCLTIATGLAASSLIILTAVICPSCSNWELTAFPAGFPHPLRWLVATIALLPFNFILCAPSNHVLLTCETVLKSAPDSVSNLTIWR